MGSQFVLDIRYYVGFFFTLPICGLLLWFWITKSKGDHLNLKRIAEGLAVWILLTVAAIPLSVLQYLPGFAVGRGFCFSYLNSTFNASFMVYVVLNLHHPVSRRVLPVSIAYLVMTLFVSYFLGLMRTSGNGMNIHFQMMIFTLQAVYLYVFVVAVDGYHPVHNIMTWSIITLVRDMAANLYRLVQNLFGINDMVTNALFVEWPSYWTNMLRFAFFLGIFWLISHVTSKLDRDSENVTPQNAAVVGIIVLLVTGPLYAIIRNFQQESFIIGVCCKVLYIIIYFLLLYVRFSVKQQAFLDGELEITKQLLYHEQKHYDSVRQNIELVNIRCHDINRQLKKLQSKLTDAELTSLQEAIRIYDSNIRTGSEICDMVLFQKNLFCQQNQIRLSCVIDGKPLNIMRGTDLYALLENILENAIEATCKLENPEKRLIDLTAMVKDGVILLECNNYYDINTSLRDFQTTKQDAGHHGFGLKSIRYIASEYHGDVCVFTMDDIFTVQVKIPLPE